MLSLLLIGAMICYIQGLSSPLLGMIAMLLIIVSPFYAANRLRHFRDEARQGIISFMRAYGYTILTYFYAGLLLAVAVFVYFHFLDNGYLMGKLMEMLNTEEGRQVVSAYGMSDEISLGMEELSRMRPIDYAFNILTINISSGFILGLPIAALMQRTVANQDSLHTKL